MTITSSRTRADVAHRLALEGFQGGRRTDSGSHAAWRALRSAGTELWLDTGDLTAAREVWTNDFSNLTTNNTLVNAEVQRGEFDELIAGAGAALKGECPDLSPDELVIEVGFVVNCRTALRLVEAFDATVSVELHPAMADDAARSVEYGLRYFAVCPERFIVKVPMTPAGFLAARRLVEREVPINYTLGFSARQNVLAADFSRTDFVNVFLGRLNSFTSDYGLGTGENVGEQTTRVTQRLIRQGRAERGWRTRLIAASMRSGDQAYALAGADIFTMPTGAAAQYMRQWNEGRTEVRDCIGEDLPVAFTPDAVGRLLWSPDAEVDRLCTALRAEDTSGWTGGDFADFARRHGPRGLFPEFSEGDIETIRTGGKIPDWNRWSSRLQAGDVALDSLMSAAALLSFEKDQAELDGRIRKILGDSRVL